MGVAASTPINPEGLANAIYDQNDDQQMISASVYSLQGCRVVNQDSAVFCQAYGSEDGVFCGVFDGHGKYGHIASRIVSRRLPLRLLDKKNAVSEANENHSEIQSTQDESDSSSTKDQLQEWEEACLKAFPEIDDELKKVVKADFTFSGTTAVVALKQGDDLLIANLGDSRAILGTKSDDGGLTAVQLTTDLKAGTPDEALRIRKAKGRVFSLRDEPGSERAWLPRVRTPGIAMSRCFGDFVMKNYGIISDPVITRHHITSDDQFILLATDGIWDVLSNEEVVSIVKNVEHEKMAAKAVAEAAAALWKKNFFRKVDDCTVICYFLQKNENSQTENSKDEDHLLG